MRWLFVWTLVKSGEFLWFLMSNCNSMAWLYRYYNWVMVTSNKLQGKRSGKYWPWKEPEKITAGPGPDADNS